MSLLKYVVAAALVVSLGTSAHGGLISLSNAGFDDDPTNANGSWASVVWQTADDGVGPQSGSYFFNLLQGNDSGAANWLLQSSAHTIVAGETYSLSYCVSPRAQVYVDNPGYLVDVSANLYDITSNTTITSMTTMRNAMVANWQGASKASWLHQTLTYTIPEGDPSIGHTLGVVFTPVNGSSWACQTCLDTVSLTLVPEPSTVLLLISGAFGLLAYAWRKRG